MKQIFDISNIKEGNCSNKVNHKQQIKICVVITNEFKQKYKLQK